jgi:hypothetical protein
MTWATHSSPVRPTIVYPFASPTTVSTETPLLPLTELGAVYERLTFTLRNHDLTHSAAFYVDQSESGVAADEERRAVVIGAGKERQIALDDVLSLYFGISAAGDPDGGFPSVSVSWQVVGVRR